MFTYLDSRAGLAIIRVNAGFSWVRVISVIADIKITARVNLVRVIAVVEVRRIGSQFRLFNTFRGDPKALVTVRTRQLREWNSAGLPQQRITEVNVTLRASTILNT